MLLTATGLALIAAPGAAQVPTVPEQGSTTAALPPPVRRGEPTIVRAADGSVTIRAVQLEEPLSLDGRLDELIYESVPSAGGFIQQDPLEGEAATEETELWIFFDDRNLYVSVRAWDSQPERMVASELRRDGRLNNGENVSVVLDTFYDRRNGFYFQTNPLGAMRDQEFTDEGNPNPDWDTVWEVRSGRFDQGWTLEMAIPFKSLRYAGAGPQVWGFNIRRFMAGKNERAFLTPMPRSYGNPGIYKISLAATLVGIDAPARSINLEAKPYGISSLITDQTAVEPFANRTTGDVGFDIKYGLTPGLTADLTVNTDFAQVEADDQQVNLTRFNLSLSEKRDFFLEGRGIFAFGTGSAVGQSRGSSDIPVMFSSRQIGLSEGQAVPVRVGARLTGKAGLFTVGALNVQTGEAPGGGAPSTNFSVVRVKRAVLGRSSVGMIATHRTPSADDSGSNTLWGLDSNFPFLTDWEITSYYARSSTPLLAGKDASYRVQVDYNGDRYGFQVGHLMVGESFNPEIGFMRRADFRLSSALARFSPRPSSLASIRRLVWQAGLDYLTDESGHTLKSHEAQALFRAELQNSDSWSIQYARQYELLEDSFPIARRQGIVIPPGGYHFGAVSTSYQLGSQRPVNGRLSAEHGSFFSGDRTTVGYSGRLEFSPRFSVEPSLSQNWIDLAEGQFDTRLATARAIFTPSPRTVLSAFLQYN